MDEDVNKAIKQLETIAIKAMNSGYLDDAAKVMHIAEEIERVDKSGVVNEHGPGAASHVNLSTGGEPDVGGGQRNSAEFPNDSLAELQPINSGRLDESATCNDLNLSGEACSTGNPEAGCIAESGIDASNNQNVISLNKLRMKRGASLRSKGTPSSQG